MGIRILRENGFGGRLAVAVVGGKLASRHAPRHKLRMRRLIPLVALLVAGCASTPTPEPVQPSAPSPVATNDHDHSTLDGMTANELGQHFGRPRLQIREGDGTKMQFAGPSCVLDAYLYPSPSGAGVPRVTHIDTRNSQGSPVNAQNCIASLEAH